MPPIISWSKEKVEQLYLGKHVHIIINNPTEIIDCWGDVTAVDNKNYLYGTWGDFSVDPSFDYVGLDD